MGKSPYGVGLKSSATCPGVPASSRRFGGGIVLNDLDIECASRHGRLENVEVGTQICRHLAARSGHESNLSRRYAVEMRFEMLVLHSEPDKKHPIPSNAQHIPKPHIPAAQILRPDAET